MKLVAEYLCEGEMIDVENTITCLGKKGDLFYIANVKGKRRYTILFPDYEAFFEMIMAKLFEVGEKKVANRLKKNKEQVIDALRTKLKFTA